MPPVDVTIRYLEMTSPGQLRARRSRRDGLRFVKVPVPTPELNRYCYLAIGGRWSWLERRGWSPAEWETLAARPALETWVLAVDDAIAGYCELERSGEEVELKYFGLIPAFIGGGLGAHLLTEAVERAWAMGASRVILNTCNLDHPHALANYAARGFREFRTEVQRKEVPHRSPDAWTPPVRLVSSFIHIKE
jgi:GNAT superfamily N-acetyltransferase